MTPVREFLKPDNKKIGVAIATALIFFNIYLFLGFIPCITGETNCIFAWSWLTPLAVLLLELYYMCWGVLFYPFACSVVALYEARTDIRNTENKVAVVIGLGLLNPLVVFWVITTCARQILFG
ncbi:MAG: hypothetical protein WCX63_05400 [Methanoregula sp.]